jgi:hypothetical protein
VNYELISIQHNLFPAFLDIQSNLHISLVSPIISQFKIIKRERVVGWLDSGYMSALGSELFVAERLLVRVWKCFSVRSHVASLVATVSDELKSQADMKLLDLGYWGFFD